jgi:hypothetical protein
VDRTWRDAVGWEWDEVEIDCYDSKGWSRDGFWTISTNPRRDPFIIYTFDFTVMTQHVIIYMDPDQFLTENGRWQEVMVKISFSMGCSHHLPAGKRSYFVFIVFQQWKLKTVTEDH